MAAQQSQLSLETRFRRYYTNLTPILKKPKMRASTTAIFSFLAVSLFLWYAVRPTAQTIIYLQREIADKTVLNQQMEAKISALIEAQATYENLGPSLISLDNALPANPNAVVLAREIQHIAAVSEASVSSIAIPTVPLVAKEATLGAKLIAQKPLQEFPITVSISGPYASVKSFLDNLITLQRITTIDLISIKPGGVGSAGSGVLQLSIRLKSYYSLQ